MDDAVAPDGRKRKHAWRKYARCAAWPPYAEASERRGGGHSSGRLPPAPKKKKKKKTRHRLRGEEEERGQRHVSEYGAYSSTNKPAHHRRRAVVGATQLREYFNAHAHTHIERQCTVFARTWSGGTRGAFSRVIRESVQSGCLDAALARANGDGGAPIGREIDGSLCLPPSFRFASSGAALDHGNDRSH